MSNVSLQVLQEFYDTFKGNENGHGVHIYDKNFIQYGGLKEEGKTWTEVNESVTIDMYEEHLNGGNKGLGISPVNNHNKCNYAVIDVDIYEKLRIHNLIDICYNSQLPLLPFRTKSGGLHLYVFFDEPVFAKDAIFFCRQFKYLLGVPKDTEIFPKQETLTEKSIGNWTNLPYYDFENPRTGLLNAKYEIISLQEALVRINDNKINIKNKDEYLNRLPLSDAPPCLQIIYLARETKDRNNYLFSLARYFKSKYGDDFEQYVQSANNELRRPLTTDELSKTAIATHKKKDYTYKCKDEPICSICNKDLCKNREYGIGGDLVSELDYGTLTQIKTDPPTYNWVINGKTLTFFDESEIINQNRFIELCIRELHKFPFKLKSEKWNKIVNTALDNIQVTEIREGDDLSPGSMLKEHLVEFFEHRKLAENREQIMIDRVWKDDELASYVFKQKNLIHFLISQKNFKEFGTRELSSKLINMGAGPYRYTINRKYGNVRVWLLPYKALDGYKEEAPIEDFKLKFDKEDVSDKLDEEEGGY